MEKKKHSDERPREVKGARTFLEVGISIGEVDESLLLKPSAPRPAAHLPCNASLHQHTL